MIVANASVLPDRIALVVALILVLTFLTALQDTIFKYAGADMTLSQLCVLRLNLPGVANDNSRTVVA